MVSSQMLSALLGDLNLRNLFITIVEKKRLQGRDLVDMAAPETKQMIYGYLERLKNEGVIEVDTSSPIPDFRTYYITSEGLATFRELHRILAVSAIDTRTNR